jgi:hypothetical protein
MLSIERRKEGGTETREREREKGTGRETRERGNG